ncbi:MAG: transglutaminase [Acidobacteria bacterium]|nr:transglutaminase [Acidobacteriota bacterium]
MNRREFIRRAGVTAAGLALVEPSRLFAQDAPDVRWRTFEITTRVEVLQAVGPTRVWLPMPLAAAAPFQKTFGDNYRAEGGSATMVERDDLDMLVAEWPDDVTPLLKVVSRVATAGHAADLTKPTVPPPADMTSLSPFLRPTRLMPTDGIVKATATEITRGHGTDFEKARAIYEWIVENTFRDPKTPGCGLGDIRFMLETKNLSGKCADINGLFVGLARAAGLPSRDLYGLRVAKSDQGFSSLGLSSENATKAQHCRAEVYLVGYGWVPVDPADVRKVALEEPPGHLPLDHDKVRDARKRLFGSWEMNWIAYNFANDVTLPGSKGRPIGYFMYPQGETANGRLDSLDPDAFRYEIFVKEVS